MAVIDPHRRALATKWPQISGVGHKESEDKMIFPDTPEARNEIDRLLDPDDPVLLESDRNRVSGSLADIARILIRTARSLTEDQKAEIRGDFTESDKKMLRQMGVR